MLSPEQNRLLTETGPGTPGGDLQRCYWQPAALAAELGSAPLSVRLLGEDLVLFRQADGTPALIDRRCPHRLVDLSYGRVEDGGLRCLYHGWLIGADGRCREQPGEPAGSTFAQRVSARAYPCREVAGLILTYLGPGEPPLVPSFPFATAPLERVWSSKMLLNCNYLQGNEGNVDPQHLSFLHRFFKKLDDDPAFDASRPLWVADPAPRIEVEDTPYGLRIYAIRAAGDEQYVRITNFIMPNNSSFLGSAVVDPANGQIPESSYYHFHWHVPIDDRNHWKYRIAYRIDGPVDKAYLDGTMGAGPENAYDRPRRRENRYLQDRAEMRSASFAGLGYNFHDHDRFAVETQGEILDRSDEHLGATDKGVAAMRRVMLRALEDLRAGSDPLMVRRAAGDDPFAEFVTLGERLPAGVDIKHFWRVRT